jgi:SOS-response transcriptional repressor LexA
MEIGERLDRARQRVGLSRAELAQRAGMARSSVSDILNGKQQPSYKTVERLVRAMGISFGVLYDEPHIHLSAADAKLSREFHQFLGRFLDADEAQKRLRDDDAHVLAPRGKRPIHMLREGGREPVHLNPRSEVVSLPNEVIPQQYVRLGAHRAFRVLRDVMIEAGIYEGDIIYVRPSTDVDAADGDIIVCKLNDALYLKRLDRRGNQTRLCNENKRYEAIDVKDRDDFALLGVVCTF